METITQKLKQTTSKIRLTEQVSTEPKLVDLAKEAQLFRAAILQVEPKFDINKANKEVLNSIFAWVWKQDSINTLHLDYNKGLLLFGDLGLGKTMTLHALRTYVNSVVRRGLKSQESDYRMVYWWKSASELANVYASDGQSALIQYANPYVNLVIDELGREPNPASCYGTKMDVIAYLLQLRYDYRRTSVTHITTNLNLKAIASTYGTYIADRCLEMFNFIEFTGKSLRK